MTALEPEVPERAGQAQTRVRLAGQSPRLPPLQRRPEIVVLGLHPVEPLRGGRVPQRGGSTRLGGGLRRVPLRQAQVVVGVPPAGVVRLPAGLQLLQGELADRLQHHQSRGPVRAGPFPGLVGRR